MGNKLDFPLSYGQDGRVFGESVQCDGLYTGEHLNGKADGQGTVMFSDGRTYQGCWRNGKIHGPGKSTGGIKDNYAFEYAETKDGVLHGKSLYQLKNGQLQFKEYRGGRLHGYCIKSMKNDSFVF